VEAILDHGAVRSGALQSAAPGSVVLYHLAGDTRFTPVATPSQRASAPRTTRAPPAVTSPFFSFPRWARHYRSARGSSPGSGRMGRAGGGAGVSDQRGDGDQ
jgi:hypothetical protein